MSHHTTIDRDLPSIHREAGIHFKREQESARYFGICTIQSVSLDGQTLYFAWDKDTKHTFCREKDSPMVHPADWHVQLLAQNRKRKKLVKDGTTTRLFFHTHGQWH